MATAAVLEEINRISLPVDAEKIEQIGMLASKSDPKVGNLIKESMRLVGKDGGMQFDRRFLSHYFITDSDRMECVLEKAFILVHEKKVASMKELLPLLETPRSSALFWPLVPATLPVEPPPLQSQLGQRVL